MSDELSIGVVPTNYVSTVRLCRDTGLTYRQVDFWCRRGYIDAVFYDPDTGEVLDVTGSGYRRAVTHTEAQRVRVIAALVQVGVSVAAADRIATAHVEKNARYIRLSKDIVIGLGEAIA